MKKMMNLKGVKVLSRKEQKNISGSHHVPFNLFESCGNILDCAGGTTCQPSIFGGGICLFA